MSTVSSVGNAAYALYQVTARANGTLPEKAEQQRQRSEQVTTELLQARIHQTQVAAEILQAGGLGSRVNTYA
jgi:hypothetical protein